MKLGWLGLLLTTATFTFGQTQATTVSVNTFRPMVAAALKLQSLSQIPINYEDVRCDFPGDQVIIPDAYTTAQQQQAAQNGAAGPLVDIAPRGGPLLATIGVNSIGQLADANGLAEAINSIVSAYSGSGLPGTFSFEQYNGAFFLAPTATRDQAGATVKTPPILSTPITLSVTQAVAYDTLKQILGQVYQSTGYRIDIGSVPINGLAMARLTFHAAAEPANHVLMWLLNSLLGYGQVLPAQSPSYAYHVLYDPKLKYYMFNVVEVAARHNL